MEVDSMSESSRTGPTLTLKGLLSFKTARSSGFICKKNEVVAINEAKKVVVVCSISNKIQSLWLLKWYI